MRRMMRPSVMKETTRITPWQRGQTSGSISYTRLRSRTHPRRRGADEGDGGFALRSATVSRGIRYA